MSRRFLLEKEHPDIGLVYFFWRKYGNVYHWHKDCSKNFYGLSSYWHCRAVPYADMKACRECYRLSADSNCSAQMIPQIWAAVKKSISDQRHPSSNSFEGRKAALSSPQNFELF